MEDHYLRSIHEDEPYFDIWRFNGLVDGKEEEKNREAILFTAKQCRFLTSRERNRISALLCRAGLLAADLVNDHHPLPPPT